MERCAYCKMQAIRTCALCSHWICEEHLRLGVDRRGQLQGLCIPCDERRQGYVTWPERQGGAREGQENVDGHQERNKS